MPDPNLQKNCCAALTKVGLDLISFPFVITIKLTLMYLLFQNLFLDKSFIVNLGARCLIEALQMIIIYSVVFWGVDPFPVSPFQIIEKVWIVWTCNGVLYLMILAWCIWVYKYGKTLWPVLTIVVLERIVKVLVIALKTI